MIERLRYALFGGISLGLSFGLVILISLQVFSSNIAFPEILWVTIFLILFFVGLSAIISILIGRLFRLSSVARLEYVFSSGIPFILTLMIVALYLAIIFLAANIIMAGIDVAHLPEYKEAIPPIQIEGNQRQILQLYCGPITGTIFGAIFGFIFGIILNTPNRVKTGLLGSLFGALGFGLGGLLSGGIIPTTSCLLLKSGMNLWPLVFDGTIFGFFGGAGLGIVQQIGKSPSNV